MKTRLAPVSLVLAGLAPLLALAACHSQPTAGGLTAEEERQLDNAAAMLDDNTIAEMGAAGRADSANTPAAAPTPAPPPAQANAVRPAPGNRSRP